MYYLYISLKNLLKSNDIIIDNKIFRLHYRITFVLLLFLSMLVTSRQYFGDPIDCIIDGVPQNLIDTYCWIHTTYSIPNTRGTIGKDLVYPGVRSQYVDRDKVVHHKYYQWVCFVLFFQALLFYAPGLMWKHYEGGFMRKLAAELNQIQVNDNTKKTPKENVIRYFLLTMKNHNIYAIKFHFCEFLTLVNVVSQIFLINWFLGGQFFTYGIETLTFMQTSPEWRDDPMSKVFPYVAKCTFYKFGASGSVQVFDSLCILPLNVLNEKIYVFLWIWFLFLACLSLWKLTHRVLFFCSRKFRLKNLKEKLIANNANAYVIMMYLNFGDFFVLKKLAQNVPQQLFNEFVDGVCQALERKNCLP